jgi:hypothetical protein
MQLVTVYYNDIFISVTRDDEPFEVYENCPYVNLPIEIAEDIASEKINSHEWESYLIPELTTRKIIYHEDSNG